MMKIFMQSIMAAETDAVCGAGYGERSAERVIAGRSIARRQQAC